MTRFWLFGLVNAILALCVVTNVYYTKKQFYPTCMHLSQSDASYMILLSFAIYCAILSGMMLQAIFLGPLRLIEAEHLYENSWYSISEIFLAMTIFREEFDTKFAFFFCILLAMKIFHWLTKDRLDYMEQTPVLTRLFHIRMTFLLISLLISDVLFARYSMNQILNKGPSMMIMFAFESAILIVQVLCLVIKYVLNVIDLRNEEPWESKSIYLFYLELTSDFFKLILYTCFFMMIVHYYGIPLHIIRDLYLTFRSFVLRVRDLIQYRRATTNMDQRYPNATLEELSSSDRVCIICREEMNLEAKKLPCGHLFHFQCLRSWLERQQTCPICRRSVLEEDNPSTQHRSNITRDNQSAVHARPMNPIDINTRSPTVIIPPESEDVLENLPLLRNTSNSIILSRFPKITCSPSYTDDETEIEAAILDEELSLMTDEQLLELEGNMRENISRRIRYLRTLSTRINRLCDHMTRVNRMFGHVNSHSSSPAS